MSRYGGRRNAQGSVIPAGNTACVSYSMRLLRHSHNKEVGRGSPRANEKPGVILIMAPEGEFARSDSVGGTDEAVVDSRESLGQHLVTLTALTFITNDAKEKSSPTLSNSRLLLHHHAESGIITDPGPQTRKIPLLLPLLLSSTVQTQSSGGHVASLWQRIYFLAAIVITRILT